MLVAIGDLLLRAAPGEMSKDRPFAEREGVGLPIVRPVIGPRRGLLPGDVASGLAGPAPRGLDRFPITIEGTSVVVDTGRVEVGPPRGTSTWEKFAGPQGPFCVPT